MLHKFFQATAVREKRAELPTRVAADIARILTERFMHADRVRFTERDIPGHRFNKEQWEELENQLEYGGFNVHPEPTLVSRTIWVELPSN